jgi:hypothetical protein
MERGEPEVNTLPGVQALPMSRKRGETWGIPQWVRSVIRSRVLRKLRDSGQDHMLSVRELDVGLNDLCNLSRFCDA